MTDITFSSITQLSQQLQDKHLSPVELTESVLALASKLQPHLNMFVELLPEHAMAQARAAEAEFAAGLSRGPLHGIPYVAKDLYDVAGHATRAGTSLLNNNVVDSDATVVARLAQAGAVLIGKTHTVQFAFGGVGINHDQGTPHNPWHETACAPGGSSSGTGVAVGAGLVPMGLGSDTGGSVRIPAALCGVAGLKTTVGRISRAGVYPLSYTLDTVGPLTRTVKDCAISYRAMQGVDERDPLTFARPAQEVMSVLDRGVGGMRLRFVENTFWDDADSAVVDAVRATGRVFGDLGAHVGSMELSEVAELTGGENERYRAMVIAAEACAVNGDLLDNHFDELDPPVAQRMITGRDLSGTAYFKTIRWWEALQASVVDSLRDVDAVLVPTTPITGRPLTEIDASRDAYVKHNMLYLRNTSIGNMLNLCGVSVPCGFDERGMPIGLMVYAKPFHEETALRVAQAFERATDWHTARPDLSWTGE